MGKGPTECNPNDSLRGLLDGLLAVVECDDRHEPDCDPGSDSEPELDREHEPVLERELGGDPGSTTKGGVLDNKAST
jgi:hypothetical protein